ncbi:MAG: Periplasmic protein [Candidatus Tokpelaia hoelldobleri]|uniref:Periplasmic protein n=1 Tax=Candidatus Tokpelaia hoelldobleri TaxID=1902579 RepID=A0A1U9JTD8_9HYPH|nr:MAG: Periplasmic protein [Candidatus Tokpelaia hoelldoblerii]
MAKSRRHKIQLVAYSRGAIVLHWLIALGIIAQLVMGFLMVRAAPLAATTQESSSSFLTSAVVRTIQFAQQNQFFIFQWHKTIGILVLFLSIARIIWRLMNKPPEKAPMSAFEKITSDIVVFFFYVLMITVPVIGWIIVSTSPTQFPTRLFLLPDLVWPNLPLAIDSNTEQAAANAHALLAYSFVLLLFLHIGGALKHSIFDRVPELSRMSLIGKLHHKKTARGSVIISSLFALLLGAGALLFSHYNQSSTPAAATDAQQAPVTGTTQSDWVVDKQKSTLSYEVAFSGEPVSGTIGNWDAIIHFNPAAPQKARADIAIDANSINYGHPYVADSLPGTDGFDTAEYPQVRAVLDHFSKDQNGWQATGTITIRGKTRPLTLNFTYQENNGHAIIQGSADIDRLAFDLGRQNDASGTWLGKTVRVDLVLEADRK